MTFCSIGEAVRLERMLNADRDDQNKERQRRSVVAGLEDGEEAGVVVGPGTEAGDGGYGGADCANFGDTEKGGAGGG